MRKTKLPVLLLIIFSISACHAFLGPDPANNPKGIFDQIWNDFNETYALFNVKNIDWDETYKTYSPRISSGMSDYELFHVCSEMLNSLEDIHVRLVSPFGDSIFFAYDDLNYNEIAFELRKDFYFGAVREYLKDGGKYAGNGRFLFGIFDANPRIGYIYIEEFAVDFIVGSDIIPAWVKEINGIVNHLCDTTDALVLDVRGNMGGIGSNMEYIASRFIATEKPYLSSRTKNGPGRNDFSPFATWIIKPAENSYTKPIVLLTNENTLSAGEWFTMALRSQSHVTHMGATTKGAFSTRIVRPLINGWKYSISVQDVRDLDGTSYEGKGIPPMAEILSDPDYSYDDEQLEEAIAWLSS